jgi:archaellum component FlaF (FlaF/FlaG flagellin family)
MKNLYFLFFTVSFTMLSFGQVPTLTILDGPANGSSVVDDPETATPGNATIDFTTTNFIMSTDAGGGTGSGGDGFIKWSIVNINDTGNNDGGNIFTSNDFFEYDIIGLINGATYDFISELVDNNGDPLGSPVVYSFTITIASYIDVANLAALRASAVNPDLYYRVNGQVINTHTISEADQTMFFQDGTAGIKVYDPEYKINSYITGDAVSNIKGHLELVNGVLQFVPTYANWGTPDTTGNIPAVSTVTIATLMTTWEAYESELVKINGVTFADGNDIDPFMASTDYAISDGTSSVFRTSFSNADYIGQLIPSGTNNIVVLVSEENGNVNVTARNSADFSMVLSSEDFEINSFKLYPNPTSSGYVTISNSGSAIMTVSVFDLLGKQVIIQNVSNKKLDVSSLNMGVYLMKIILDNHTTYKRLIIE